MARWQQKLSDFFTERESKENHGSALVTVLVLIAVALVVTTSAIVVAVTNTQVTTQQALAEQALATAEAGAEEALIRLVRNPNYSGGTLSVGGGTATMTVSGTTAKTIVSVGSIQGLQRTVQVVASVSSTVITPTSWQEI